MTTCCLRGYWSVGRHGVPSSCESQATSSVSNGFGSGSPSWPHVPFVVCSVGGELPSGASLPLKQLIGFPGSEVISPKSLFVGFPKKPLFEKVLLIRELPQSS
jgi:hypothetical protein